MGVTLGEARAVVLAVAWRGKYNSGLKIENRLIRMGFLTWPVRAATVAIATLASMASPFVVSGAAQTLSVVHSAACGGDGGNYGARLLGSAWPGGFTGVPVHSNGSDSRYDEGCENSATSPSGATIPTGTKWQCTELVNRLYVTKGWINTTWPGDGDTMWTKAPDGLQGVPQGSISYVSPGDVVSINVYDSGSLQADGHVLVVSAVSGSAVTYVSQNAGQNTVATVTSSGALSDGKLTVDRSGAWTYAVLGIVHAPTVRGGPLSRPFAVDRSSASMDVFFRTPSGGLAEDYWTSAGGWVNQGLPGGADVG